MLGWRQRNGLAGRMVKGFVVMKMVRWVRLWMWLLMVLLLMVMLLQLGDRKLRMDRGMLMLNLGGR